MELFGIPGGAAVVYIRLCFSRKGDAQGELMMAATVNPPENSWFKGNQMATYSVISRDRIDKESSTQTCRRASSNNQERD